MTSIESSGLLLCPPLEGGGSGGWAAGRGIGSRAAHCAAGRSRGRRRRATAAAGRQAIAGAVARTPQRARGQGRHRRRRPTSHPDVWVRSSSTGGRTTGGSGSPLFSGAALAVGRKRRGGGAGRVGSRTFGGRERSPRARRQRSAATRPRSAPLRAVAGGVWAGARTHGSRDGDTKSGVQRSEERLWRRQPTGVCIRKGARDFGGKIPRQAPQARRPRTSALFLYSSLSARRLAAVPKRRFREARTPFWTRILKRALFGLFFCQLATALGNFRFRRRRMSRFGEGRQRHRQHAGARGRVDGRRRRAPI